MEIFISILIILSMNPYKITCKFRILVVHHHWDTSAIYNQSTTFDKIVLIFITSVSRPRLLRILRLVMDVHMTHSIWRLDACPAACRSPSPRTYLPFVSTLEHRWRCTRLRVVQFRPTYCPTCIQWKVKHKWQGDTTVWSTIERCYA